MTTAIRIYSSGAITDVVPTANWIESWVLAQYLTINAGEFQGTTGTFVCISGATTSRPSPAQLLNNNWNRAVVRIKFFDTTLGKLIVYDGAGGWRDPATGALV